APVPGENVLTGVGVSPFPVGGVTNGIYALSNLSFLAPGAPDVIGGWAPNSTGNTQAFAGLITFSLDLGPPIGVVDFIPLHLPQAITFLSVAPEDILPLGTFYVSNLVGGAGLGSVIMFPPDAGTPGNPLGTLNGLPAPVLSVLTCAAGAPTTGLLLPVGVALDSLGHLFVVNSGAGAGTSYVTEYAFGAAGCTPPINLFGAGTLVRGAYAATDGNDNLWVTDLGQNA